MGDYDVRGRGLDGVFAQEVVTDSMIDADRAVRAELGNDFPGWALYRRIAAGVRIHDDDLAEWAYLTGTALAKARKRNGRAFISGATAAKPGWIARASWDALDRVIEGGFPEGLNRRAARYGVSSATYQAIRDTVAGGMLMGLETYKAMLHAEYLRARMREKWMGLN